jgi:hypothetical protein
LSTDIVRERDQRTAPVDILEGADRQVVADDLGRDVGGARIDADAVPILDRLLAQDRRDRIGVEVALAVEIGVKAPAREPGIRHDVVDRHGVEAMAIEQSAGALDDLLTDPLTVLGRKRHRFPPLWLKFMRSHRLVWYKNPYVRKHI